MGTWIDGSIYVRTFSKEAFNKVKNIDLYKEFSLPGNFSAHGNCLSYKEDVKDSFDAEDIVRRIAKVLNGDGTVYAVYECTEDWPIAYTCYCFGDGVKTVCFFYDGGGDEVLYDSLAWRAALQWFSPEEFRAICQEAFSEYTDEDPLAEQETDEEMMEDLLELIHEGVYDMEEEFFDTPHLKKALDRLKKITKICRFEDHDFDPDLSWEKKGYVKFTGIEKAYLKAFTSD